MESTTSLAFLHDHTYRIEDTQLVGTRIRNNGTPISKNVIQKRFLNGLYWKANEKSMTDPNTAKRTKAVTPVIIDIQKAFFAFVLKDSTSGE